MRRGKQKYRLCFPALPWPMAAGRRRPLSFDSQKDASTQGSRSQSHCFDGHVIMCPVTGAYPASLQVAPPALRWFDPVCIHGPFFFFFFGPVLFSTFLLVPPSLPTSPSLSLFSLLFPLLFRNTRTPSILLPRPRLVIHCIPF